MSGYDDSDPDQEEVRTSAYRQDLRKRLRQREQKLLDLIRSSQRSSGTNGILRNGTRSASRANGGGGAGEESNRLLDSRQAQQGRPSYSVAEDDEFDDVGGRSSGSGYRYETRRPSRRDDLRNGEVRARLEGIERVSSQQASVIRALENEVSMRNVEVDELRNELVKKLERIVLLEIEIENRDYSFDRSVEGGADLERADIEAADKLSPRQAQVFFAQLLADLRDLEGLYKDERLKSSVLQDQLRLENELLRRDVSKSLASLDERLERADDERRRLASALVDREMEVQELKRTLADLRLRAVITEGGNRDDDVFDDLAVDQLESRSTNRRRVRQEQEEAVERARRETSSIRPLPMPDRSRAARFDDDDRRDSFDEVDIDNVILGPSARPTSSRSRSSEDGDFGDQRSSRSPSRRQSARYLEDGNPVFAERASSYDDEDLVGFDRPTMRNSSSRQSNSNGYDRSLSPSRRSVLREQELAIERARSSSSLLAGKQPSRLAVRTVPFEEPLVGSNGAFDDDGSDFGSVAGPGAGADSSRAAASSASSRSRRAVQRDQEKNIQRAKRGGFFSRLTRIGKAQLVEI